MRQNANVTLSLPNHLIVRMHKYLPKGQISRFTSEVLTKALDELQKHKETELDAAYETASRDKEREKEAKEWCELDIDKIEGWEWDDE